MAGGTVKYRHLSRKSSHRQALLRNLVTSLVRHESILTTWPKAKEAQRMAEKLITLAKRNNETSKRAATGILYTPQDLLPKLFGELRQRYATRAGGYTRVLRTEPRSNYDQGASAVLQLVDGPKDLRFAMTAAAVARDAKLGRAPNSLTQLNRTKVLRYRPDGERQFADMVERIARLDLGGPVAKAASKLAATKEKAAKAVKAQAAKAQTQAKSQGGESRKG
ncbi:ribosomal protein L17 [Biscogniauxia mediterranea]|nr:ribosomal protein L17 [Biscogniauxia mediterranea]